MQAFIYFIGFNLKKATGKFPFKAPFLAGCWLLVMTILQNVYRGEILPLLTIPSKEPPINTIRDLEEAMRDRGYSLLYHRNSFLPYTLSAQRSKYAWLNNQVFRTFRDLGIAYKPGMKDKAAVPIQGYAPNARIFAAVRRNKLITWAHRVTAENMMRAYRRVYRIVPFTQYDTRRYVYLLSKGSHYTKILNTM